eukprot:4518813-Pleurochrysis_carterae.AAC.1
MAGGATSVHKYVCERRLRIRLLGVGCSRYALLVAVHQSFRAALFMAQPVVQQKDDHSWHHLQPHALESTGQARGQRSAKQRKHAATCMIVGKREARLREKVERGKRVGAGALIMAWVYSYLELRVSSVIGDGGDHEEVRVEDEPDKADEGSVQVVLTGNDVLRSGYCVRIWTVRVMSTSLSTPLSGHIVVDSS